ncbi:MAG: DUF1176 domain-containing protein [Leptolyngbya sp. DLM2.Bin27]|nr:MAG: DUF1176 domain-containing protein [Leptolyngbya sp. DLM2.Bin27]
MGQYNCAHTEETRLKDIKLQGLVAALVTVAIAGCNPPPSSTPAVSAPEPGAGDLPTEEVILQTVYAEVESLDLCDGFLQPEVAQANSQVWIMGDRALVEINCALVAYQMVYAYAVYHPDGSVQPLSLDVFDPDATGAFGRSREATVGGLADFDPDQGQLTIFSKARGLGDCGSLADYRWSGAELELDTFRYQACSDTAEADLIDPADYPQIYP